MPEKKRAKGKRGQGALPKRTANSGRKGGGRRLLALGSVTVDMTDEEIQALADEMAELIMAGIEEPEKGQPALPQPTARPAKRKGRRKPD
jgi:hypothetical protein